MLRRFSPITIPVAVKDPSTASSSSSPAIPVKIIPLQYPESTSSDSRRPSVSFYDFLYRWTLKNKLVTFLDWIDTIFPWFLWIRTYRWNQYFKLDGITVGVMLVPQAMSYAKLAGLQPIYGLCAKVSWLKKAGADG